MGEASYPSYHAGLISASPRLTSQSSVNNGLAPKNLSRGGGRDTLVEVYEVLDDLSDNDAEGDDDDEIQILGHIRVSHIVFRSP